MKGQHFASAAGALFCALFLSACGKSQIEWKEEVKLQSGEVIVVKRTAKSKDFGEIGGPGGWENEGMTVQIIQPVKSDNPPIWDAGGPSRDVAAAWSCQHLRTGAEGAADSAARPTFDASP